MSNGGSPARGENDVARELMSLDEELNMLKWYKIANESALKAAIVKNRSHKKQPRYNPAAERYQERVQLQRRVIAEEQNRPLELPYDEFLRLTQKEDEDLERRREQALRRYDRVVDIMQQLGDKEERRNRYAAFLVRQAREKHIHQLEAQIIDCKRRNLPFDELESKIHDLQLEAAQAAEDPSGEHCGGVPKSMAKLQYEKSISMLREVESKVWDVAGHSANVASGTKLLSINTSQEFGVGFVDPERSALVTFKKTRTSAKIGQPSKTQYSVRLLPGQHEALKPPRPQAEILGLPDIYEVPRTASSPKRSSRSAPNARTSGSEAGTANSKHGATATDHNDSERLVCGCSVFQMISRVDCACRVDELIRTWLRDRRKIQQQREKKLKDQLRADRNFLKQLQVASGKKDDEGKGRKQDAEDKAESPNGKDKTTPRSMAASLGLDPKNARIHLKDSEDEVCACFSFTL
jgi:hypothetical protein